MLLPHANSRGGVDTATYQSPCITYTPVLNRIDDTTATVGMPKTQTHCLEAPYPERYELASHENVAQDRFGPISWMGSLITGSRDATGQHYMRNRYYDPRSGRFTQEDPIGLAGGVNVYGFAAADPVQYRDPFGLDTLTKSERRQLGNFCVEVDCSKVNVHRGNDNAGVNAVRRVVLALSDGRAITLGYDIYLGDTPDQSGFGSLVHEMTHVYQYETWSREMWGAVGVDKSTEGLNYVLHALPDRWAEFIGRHPYDANTFASWNSLGMEQQAKRVADCFTGADPAACRYSPFQP